MDNTFLFVCEIYFLLVFIKALDSKGILNTIKKEIMSAIKGLHFR